MILMKNIFYTIVVGIVFSFVASAAEIQGGVKYQGDTLNFELIGQNNWNYDLKRVKEKGVDKIKLYVKELDQNTVNNIKNITNPFVEKISVNPKSVDQQTLIEFTLKNPNVETFDYLTDQPSKLIIDFYVKDKADEPLVENMKIKSSKKIAKNKASFKNKKESKDEFETTVAAGDKEYVGRHPAEADFLKMDNNGGIESSNILRSGLFDGGDAKFDRFSIKETEVRPEAIIKSQDNYYLNLPLLEPEFTFWSKIKSTPVEYDFSEKNTDENKQVRLLKKLFDKKKYLVFLKTADWFVDKYPESEYLESIAYMRGDALIELWRTENKDVFYKQAQFAYQQALDKYPNSKLAERTSLLRGYLALDQKDYLNALRMLNTHAENPKYKDHPSTYYAKLGAGFSLGKLQRVDEAISVLSQLEKDSKDKYVQIEAAIRKGDIYFQDKKFDQAKQTYLDISKKYGQTADTFPNLFFNLMKTTFWKKDYYPAYQASMKFVKSFPSHDYAPYALTRLGELLEILGADQSKTVGAYLETHFRYGDNPKTIIARLHLLSTRMKNMKKEELEQTLKKMDELTLKSDVPNIDQFKVALIADGFARRQDYEKSIQILSDFYQQNPMRADIQQVTHRIVKNINDYLKYLSDQKKDKQVLETYEKYADNWLKQQDRIDTSYLLGLSYDSAGAYEEAIKKYTNTKDRMLAIQNTPQQKIVEVREYLPSFDTLNLKLAKAYYNSKDFQNSYQALQQIKSPFTMSEAEQIERVQVAAELSQEKGDVDAAIRYLTELDRVWKGNPALLIPVNKQLGQLQYKKKNYEEAKKSLNKVLELAEQNNSTNLTSLREAANTLTDIFIDQKNSGDAIGVLEKFLNTYEEKNDLPKERFRLGELYFQKGEIKKAENIWSELKGKDSNFWNKVAQNKLQQANWKEEYKKYLKRIPAMSQMEKQQ